jgi:hypothetical protein
MMRHAFLIILLLPCLFTGCSREENRRDAERQFTLQVSDMSAQQVQYNAAKLQAKAYRIEHPFLSFFSGVLDFISNNQNLLGWLLGGNAAAVVAVGSLLKGWMKRKEEDLNTMTEAFEITSKVANLVPQAAKEAAFVGELAKAAILNRADLKALRDAVNPPVETTNAKENV